jgi:hypothetical protein
MYIIAILFLPTRSILLLLMKQERERIPSLPIIKLLGVIISLAIIFGLLGFVYSFFGLLDTTKNIISLEPFHLLTVQEIGGHFLFGFIVSIPLRSIKTSILIGLMALTIDSDHLLNIAGFHIQGRIDHSIPFAIASSILMGLMADKVYFKILTENDVRVVSNLSISKKESRDSNNDKKIHFFVFFAFITLSAFLSHIAYDVFVDDEAKFPLFAPFSFSEFVIPNSYGLPIELVGCIMILFISLHYRAEIYWRIYTVFRNEQKN